MFLINEKGNSWSKESRTSCSKSHSPSGFYGRSLFQGDETASRVLAPSSCSRSGDSWEEGHGAGRLNGSLTQNFKDSGQLWLAA